MGLNQEDMYTCWRRNRCNSLFVLESVLSLTDARKRKFVLQHIMGHLKILREQKQSQPAPVQQKEGSIAAPDESNTEMGCGAAESAETPATPGNTKVDMGSEVEQARPEGECRSQDSTSAGLVDENSSAPDSPASNGPESLAASPPADNLGKSPSG